MLNSAIKSGDTIDIKYLHQSKDKVYKSSVYEILNDKEVEITIPTDNGKMILFQNGCEFQFFFYTDVGVYTCEAKVIDRYKRGNYLLLIRLTTRLKKVQRREYYRLQCLLDFAYYKLPEEVAELETAEEIFPIISEPEYIIYRRMARTKDLSGGGLRFITTEPLQEGEKILIMLNLENDKFSRRFCLLTDIVTCEEAGYPEPPQTKWIARGRFKFTDIKERDIIVRYVFEEDRRLRKKESGV